MPFTIAHPALIIPLTKSSRFSVTALIIGSMVPDFEFFFQLREVENIGHKWHGIIVFNIPVALISCYIFHNLMRNLLIENLPNFVYKRCSNYLSFNWNRFAAKKPITVLISLFIGIVSHLVWDGFTHQDGLFVTQIPALNKSIGWQSFEAPFYFWLQILCSLLGLVYVVTNLVFRITEKQTNRVQENNILFWPTMLCLMASILIIRLIVWQSYNSFGGVLIAGMGSILYSWLLTSLLITIISKFKPL